MSASAVARSMCRLMPTMPPYAERGSHVVGAAVGVHGRLADGEAARVGVLDHAGRGLLELGDERARGVDVEPVGERERGALQLARMRHAAGWPGHGVERAALMRVLAVAKLVQPRPTDGQLLGAASLRPSRCAARRPPACRTPPRGRTPRRRAGGASPSESDPMLAQLGEDRFVLRWRDHDGDRIAVLGGGADERGAADVDVLDDRVLVRTARQRLGERVQRRDHDVDRLEPALGELAHVLGVVAPGEDACVDRGVQRADAAVEHLREAGDVGDRLHLDARVGERPAGAAGGDQVVAVLDQAAREFDEPGLVADREQRSHASDRRRRGRGEHPDAIAVALEPAGAPERHRLRGAAPIRVSWIRWRSVAASSSISTGTAACSTIGPPSASPALEQLHRAPGHAHAARQRPLDRVHPARERRQQRGVDVEDGVRVGVEELVAQDPVVAGADDETHPGRLETRRGSRGRARRRRRRSPLAAARPRARPSRVRHRARARCAGWRPPAPPAPESPDPCTPAGAHRGWSPLRTPAPRQGYVRSLEDDPPRARLRAPPHRCARPGSRQRTAICRNVRRDDHHHARRPC